MDGSEKQEKAEYDNIVALLSRQLGNPSVTTATKTTWEGKPSTTVALYDDCVAVSISQKKSIWRRLRDWLFH